MFLPPETKNVPSWRFVKMLRFCLAFRFTELYIQTADILLEKLLANRRQNEGLAS